MSKTRILIADDHDLIRSGLRNLLRTYRDLEISGEARNGHEAVNLAKETQPDIIFMDISMPELNGIEACRMINASNPGIKIIALSQYEDDAFVDQIIEAGGTGYMLKNSSKDEFYTAIRLCMNGQRYFSSSISDSLFKNRKQKRDKDTLLPQNEIHLTRREIELVRLIVTDHSNQDISQILSISLRTVETHRRNLMHKLQIHSVVALVKYASQRGLLDTEL